MSRREPTRLCAAITPIVDRVGAEDADEHFIDGAFKGTDACIVTIV